VLACVCVALTGCVGDQAMNYGTPAPVAMAPAPAVLPPIRPYNPPGLAVYDETPMVTNPGVLPPLRPVYLPR
jgi:hypothetical protein